VLFRGATRRERVQRPPSCDSIDPITDAKPNADNCESSTTYIYIRGGTRGFTFCVFIFLFPSVNTRFNTAVNDNQEAEGAERQGGRQPGSDFREKGVLEHLWREYSATLHKQTEADSVTGQPVTRMRSTMPAGLVFRPEVIVDIPLRTDFFKHLPGLFTGRRDHRDVLRPPHRPAGVRGIGKRRHRAQQPEQTSAWRLGSLPGIGSGHHARHGHHAHREADRHPVVRQVEKIVQLLDALSESGAGEEYLVRLVKASESSPNRIASLLKGELNQLFAELTEKQIAAANTASTALGNRIVSGIETSLKGPLNEIAESLKGASNDQGAAFQTLLSNVLETFSREMKELFGSQATGINSMQQETIQALQAAVAALEKMASGMAEAGQRSTSAMADQLQNRWLPRSRASKPCATG